MPTVKPRVCKDCATDPLTKPKLGRPDRPAPYPGPRCATHHREEQRRRRLAAAARRTEATYNLTEEQRRALLQVQGGACAICGRAKDRPRKRLAVDHDHACCAGPTSCGRCVRGLVCSPCNDTLAHLRDSPEAFVRAARYLREWPSLRAGI